MARKPYKPTKKHIETVRALKEKGATDKVCYEAIGISNHTWKKYKKDFFSIAIKKGDEKRVEDACEKYENSMDKQIEGYLAPPEIDYEYGGKGEDGEDIWIPVRMRQRYIAPNPMLTIFGLVNLSDGKYKSTNKVENTIISNTTDETPAINWTKKKNDNA